MTPAPADALRERVLEVALSEVLRATPAPDYAARVRERWEREQQERQRSAPPRASRGPRRLALVALATAAAATVIATAVWQGGRPTWEDAAGALGAAPMIAATVGLGPTSLPAGVAAFPATFGVVLANLDVEPRVVELSDIGQIELGPGALLAFERGADAAGAPPPRLLDGAALVRATGSAGLALAIGNSPAPLTLADAGAFRVELARATGPAPLRVGDLERALTEAPTKATGTFGRGALLAPTWLTIEPLQGALAWRSVQGQRIAIDRMVEGEVVDEHGLMVPLEPALSTELAGWLRTLAPIPGVDELTVTMPFERSVEDELERELRRLLADRPALWVPVSRELARRVRSHGEPLWWRGAHAVVARSDSTAALAVAREWWRAAPERFDTDALLALAERALPPFARELDVLVELEAPVAPTVDPTAPTRSGPDADRDLIALVALARGDGRFAGRALELARPLEKLAYPDALGLVQTAESLRAFVASAVLAEQGLMDPWEGARAALIERIEQLLDEGQPEAAAMIAGPLDEAARALGLAPYDPAPMGGPHLAYFPHRVRERTLAFIDPAGDGPNVSEWLDTWQR
ncbi:MAG: hypothetical protein R3F49_20010 [Planctomycetota bacterium]